MSSIDDLRRDVEYLRSVLLPPRAQVDEEASIFGAVSQDEGIRTRAFIVLAHSAIEEYVEEAISEAVKDCVDSVGVAPPAIALALAVKYADVIIGQNGGRVPSPSAIAPKLAGLYQSKVVKPNNGIRRSSLESLCKPLGLDMSSLSIDVEDAVGHLDTLGAKRGSSAHSLRGAALETVDAEQAEEWVNYAVNAVAKLIPAVVVAIATRELQLDAGRGELKATAG